MRRSSTSARILTTVIALVLTPVALALLASQGSTVQIAYFEFSRLGDPTLILGPILLQLLAGALLLLVVLTGLWSSAGLIVVGTFSVVALILSVFPALLLVVSRALPREWIDSAVYGTPLLVLTVMGAMGLVLASVRRHPRRPSAELGIPGVVVSPLLLAGGAFLLVSGRAGGPLRSLQRFEYDFQSLATLALIGGVLLLIAGVAVARWSPFALILPGVALIVASILLVVAPTEVTPLVLLLPREMVSVVPAMMFFGNSGVTGAAFLVFTAVLVRVRAQARSRPTVDGPGQGLGPFGAPPAGAYPPGQSYPLGPGPNSGNAYPPAQFPPGPPQGR